MRTSSQLSCIVPERLGLDVLWYSRSFQFRHATCPVGRQLSGPEPFWRGLRLTGWQPSQQLQKEVLQS